MGVVVVFGIIGAHWAGLDPLVRLGLKNRRPLSSRILAKPSPASHGFKSHDGPGGKKFNQDAGRLRVPQSPSNRPTRAVQNHISTPIPSQRLPSARPSPSPAHFDANLYDDDFEMPTASPRAPAYQLTRVPSSPALARGHWAPVNQPMPNWNAYEAMNPPMSGMSTENTMEYYMAGDGTPVYLETQVPPPYVDDLPGRKQPSRRRHYENFNDDGSEYGESVVEDPLDAALASYPRSALKAGRSRKKVREMTEDDHLEIGRQTKLGSKSNSKRRRQQITDFDDTRSDNGSIYAESKPISKKPRLRESISQLDPADFEDNLEDSIYADDPSIDDMSVDGDAWASGPSQLRRRSSSHISHYSAQEQQSMSKSKSIQRSKHASNLSATGSKRKSRQSSTLSDMKEVKEGLSKTKSNLTSIRGQDADSMAVDDTSTTAVDGSAPAPGTISAESSSGSLQSNSTGYGGLTMLPSQSTTAAPSNVNSVAPSTNHSPTRPETAHTGVFGIPIHSTSPIHDMTPSTPSLASSTRQARLQMLRDQSHTLVSTPSGGVSSMSRIPLTSSATKRSLEPPTVSFTPVPSIPATPMPMSTETSPTKPDAPEPISFSSPGAQNGGDDSEPEEDARISHILQSAHQRKEDKDIKQKQQEEKEKQASALKIAQASAAASSASASLLKVDDKKTEDASTDAKPAFKPLGFKPPTSTPTAPAADGTTSTTTSAPAADKPLFKVPGAAKVPSFAAPASGAAPKPTLSFGAKPVDATEATVTDADDGTSAAAPKLGGAFKFGSSASTTATATPASAATTTPTGGLFKPGAAATPTTAATPSKPTFSASAAAGAPAASPLGGLAFGNKAPTTSTSLPTAGHGFGATPAAASAPAAQTTGASLFGAKPAAAMAAPTNGTQSTAFGAAKPAPTFGTTSTPTPSPAAAFGATTPASGLFGANTTATTAPATGGFATTAKPVFGATTSGSMMTSPEKPASAFNVASTGTGFSAAPAATGTGFGAKTAFGATAQPASTAFGAASQPASNGFGAATQPASNGFSTTATGGATGFGANSTSNSFANTANRGSTLFGAGSNTAASTSSPAAAFAASKPGGTTFGTPATPGASATGFGSTTPSSGFGATSTFGAKPATGATSFGASTSTAFGAASTPSSTFGKPSTAFGASTPTGGATGFGATSTGSAFGAGASTAATAFAATNTSRAGLFGGPTSSPTPGATPFGAGTSSPAPTTSFASTPRRRTARK